MPNEVLYEKRGHIAYVTINRPDSMNAANAAVHQGLVNAYQEINRDDDVWTAVLTGAGNKAFCAGGDLKETLARSRGEIAEEHTTGPVGTWFQPRGWSGIQEVFKPIIAAVNGYAIGGGFGLALSCDIRLCSENAEFGSQARWGHLADGQAYILPRTIPLGWAFWLCTTGQRIDADTAFRLGIVQDVYPLANLMEEATKLADIINANGQVVAQHTKEFIYNSLDMPLSAARRMERVYYQQVRQNPNYDEGSAAFVEKRPPNYTLDPKP